jgi:lipopolysaccharide transport system ATP-binding protein
MKPSIEIQNLGKEYQLASSLRYVALRDVLAGSLGNLFTGSATKEKFWALQDINLPINPGERVGIIGRNGAGKSTLLKIISRITPPTKGEVVIRGRVGSLLEVGTGFHPELTGRENIYLNGSILGLKRKEINRQLDAIIDFSGVEKFIDTPLKHFSSGMQLRLAFAVAAHLEPEILLIDEVLAVGDLEFQQKCIGKMEEVSREHGRTILFVSHQLHTLAKLCDRCIWLDKGHILFDGAVHEAIQQYTASVTAAGITSAFQRTGLKDALFSSAEVLNPVIGIGEDVKIHFTTTGTYADKKLVLNINIEDEWGGLVSHIINDDAGYYIAGARAVQVTLKQLNIQPGRYYVSFWAGLDMEHPIDTVHKALSFEITSQNNFTNRLSAFPPHARVIIQSEWQPG